MAILPDVAQRICDRSLEESFGGGTQRFFRGQKIIKVAKRLKESLRTHVPTKWRRIMPVVPPLCEPERPIEQVPEVGEDLSRGSR